MNLAAARPVVTPEQPAAEAASADPPTHPVIGRVPQGYDHAITVRIVPGLASHFTGQLFGCQPRQGAPRRDADPVPLPAPLLVKLGEANRRIVAWLAQDPANAAHFLARPVEALARAGVELSRAEQKALGRLHEAATETRVVAPGVRITRLAVAANAKGRVPDPEQAPRKRPDSREKDCGCDGKD